jgi:hypothetical protein
MKLIHAKFECKGWSKKTKLSSIKAKVLQYNDSKQKFYEHFLYVIHNGKARKFEGYWFIPKPDDSLSKPYEEMKWDFTQKLNRAITRELTELEKGIYEEDKPPERKELTARQEECMRAYANTTEGNRLEVTAKKVGISIGAVHKHLEFAKKKGYKAEEFINE